MRPLIVVPARWHSTRFPGKPLAVLGDRPVIQHVYERCCEVLESRYVLIATDDERIAAAAESFGAEVEMTSSKCLTGTDRVAEVASRRAADWYINVQGDEPFVSPSAITAIIDRSAHCDEETAAINAMSEIRTESDFRSTNVPKVVVDSAARLLYVSRAAIPTDKSLSLRSARRQVGLYSFRPHALDAFWSHGRKTPLEAVEDIEILRLVELGFRVEMIEVIDGGLAVDTPEDLERARLHWENIMQGPRH